jgi:pimeloyl-ACP methyl ester carboxylesterase
MLVHGWNGRGSQLFAFVTPLVDAGYEVIAWDGPAHGDSSGTRTNLGTFAKTLVETELEVGTIEAVIAHSFGAAASVLASKMGFTANRLVLIACPCSLQDVFDRFVARLLLSTKVSGTTQKIIEKEAGLSLEEAEVDRVGSSLPVKALLIHDLLDKEIPYGDAHRILSRWQGAHLITTEGLGHRRILQAPDVVRHALSFLREPQAIP